MARLTDANVSIAKEIIGRYPRPKSAMLPLLHLAQEQDMNDQRGGAADSGR